MSFNFFNRAAKLKMAEDKFKKRLTAPTASPRVSRLGRKTQVIALAAHIGQAGQKSRIGLPHWGG